ncbi:DUF3300 domain-containing protein [Roseateles violae]|uniref:DUF3300 domain-containing protein n=1 Tax=Roseateles violae TaxID=3058042 RepID=A0ABT8DVH1_9BURK|nr:DUF3300 domain-containing protein [Pelomonas sp. PFR6]MDN3922316.1 DUF3300 domain-containing protein [Pelomonas sp. PFR6]
MTFDHSMPYAPWRRLMSWLIPALLTLLLFGGSARAQAPAAASSGSSSFSDAEIDQMLAPIALYPDSLLSQVLMASTYPADVKEAAAWTKAHPDDKGDAAIEKVKDKPWEPAVQSLVAFPQLLTMMGDKPDQVQKLGDAFLADPAKVMDRVQFLRKKAQEAGNLKSNEQQKVTNTTEEGKQVIIVEPAKTDTVYVPAYQPSVYGAWPYPSYPPYYWPPPPYYYPTGGFVAGVFWGAAVVGIANGLWGGCNWGGGDVNINVNKFNNINTNRQINNTNNKFQHNADRRGNVPYRDSASRDKYGQKARDGAANRESYRGKDGRDAQRNAASNTLSQRGADPAAGRADLQGSAGRERANQAVSSAERGGGGNFGSGDRGGAGGSGSFGSGGPGGGARDSAFSGVNNSSGSRAAADRGRSSAASSQRSMGGHSGGARAGGGGGGRRR